jgi:hypothetical protein
MWQHMFSMPVMRIAWRRELDCRQGTKLWHCLVLLQWLYITLLQPQPLNNLVTLLQQSLHPLTFSRKKENKFIIFSVTICHCTKMDNIDFHQITVTQLCMKGHTVLITFLNNLIWQHMKTTSVKKSVQPVMEHYNGVLILLTSNR